MMMEILSHKKKPQIAAFFYNQLYFTIVYLDNHNILQQESLDERT